MISIFKINIFIIKYFIKKKKKTYFAIDDCNDVFIWENIVEMSVHK